MGASVRKRGQVTLAFARCAAAFSMRTWLKVLELHVQTRPHAESPHEHQYVTTASVAALTKGKEGRTLPLGLSSVGLKLRRCVNL